MQLIGGEYGNLIHLYERDWRSNAETISCWKDLPLLTPKVRKKICNLALKLGRHIGYSGVGTVEFLVSSQGQNYFQR